MSQTILNLLKTYRPFNIATDCNDTFLNQHWVLVNGIVLKKAVYVFKKNHILHIIHAEITTETTWKLIEGNTFNITTSDGDIEVKFFLKDTNILVLNTVNTTDCALFIKESYNSNTLNSVEDIHTFLHANYKSKASHLINTHTFYYMENFKEYGPYSVKVLADKVALNILNPLCFVRDVNATDYNNRLRIRDLINAL